MKHFHSAVFSNFKCNALNIWLENGPRMNALLTHYSLAGMLARMDAIMFNYKTWMILISIYQNTCLWDVNAKRNVPRTVDVLRTHTEKDVQKQHANFVPVSREIN